MAAFVEPSIHRGDSHTSQRCKRFDSILLLLLFVKQNKKNIISVSSLVDFIQEQLSVICVTLIWNIITMHDQIYRLYVNSRGPRIEPRGTPNDTSILYEMITMETIIYLVKIKSDPFCDPNLIILLTFLVCREKLRTNIFLASLLTWMWLNTSLSLCFGVA